MSLEALRTVVLGVFLSEEPWEDESGRPHAWFNERVEEIARLSADLGDFEAWRECIIAEMLEAHAAEDRSDAEEHVTRMCWRITERLFRRKIE